MKINDELEKFIMGDAPDMANLNHAIADQFAKADFDPGNKICNRVAARIFEQPQPGRRIKLRYRLALGACTLLLGFFVYVHKRPARENLIALDWRSAHNFPYYSRITEAAAERLPPPDWRSDYMFPGLRV